MKELLMDLTKIKGVLGAVIVAKDNSLTEQEVKSFCRKYIASYKVPSIVEFRNELPKTGSGKIRKELLK